MMKPKVLPLVLIILCVGSFWAFKSLGEDGKAVSKQQKILTTLGSIIEENHYDPKPINDNFSREIYKKFLGELDPDKNILLQSDLAALKKYETYIDDEIHGATMEFLPALNAIFTKRQQETAVLYKSILGAPFNYKVDENIVTVFIISALGHYGNK